jgi:hypothetical protein
VREHPCCHLDREAWQAYGYLSSFVHAGASSFDKGIHLTNGVLTMKDGPLEETVPVRSFAASLYAKMLEDVGHIFGMTKLEQEAGKTQRAVMAGTTLS